jgi:hypothetical protein
LDRGGEVAQLSNCQRRWRSNIPKGFCLQRMLGDSAERRLLLLRRCQRQHRDDGSAFWFALFRQAEWYCSVILILDQSLDDGPFSL